MLSEIDATLDIPDTYVMYNLLIHKLFTLMTTRFDYEIRQIGH